RVHQGDRLARPAQRRRTEAEDRQVEVPGELPGGVEQGAVLPHGHGERGRPLVVEAAEGGVEPPAAEEPGRYGGAERDVPGLHRGGVRGVDQRDPGDRPVQVVLPGERDGRGEPGVAEQLPEGGRAAPHRRSSGPTGSMSSPNARGATAPTASGRHQNAGPGRWSTTTSAPPRTESQEIATPVA